jgi:hypothetical protein
VPEFSLHKLILQLSRNLLLSVQGLAMLAGELLLFSCDPERQKINKRESGKFKRGKADERENGTFEREELGREVLEGDFRKS